MRVKTETKRDAIIEAAAPLFWEHGFDRVSMAAISEAVGGSKATLYSYFKSKEELFVAVVEQHTAERKQLTKEMLSRTDVDVREALTEIATQVSQIVTSPIIVAIQRVNLSAAGIEAFGIEPYLKGPSTMWHEVSRFLQRQMDRGALRQARADVAAFQFKGLIEAGNAQPTLYGAPLEFPIEMAIEAAVDTFMRAYGPEA